MRAHRTILAAIGALALAGCERPQSMFVTANDRAYRIAELGAITLIGFTVVGLAMWALLIWASHRRRGSFEAHEPIEREDEGKSWVIVGGLLIPAFAFVALLVASLLQMNAAHHHAMAPEIRITGHRWWWQVEYLGGSPSDLVTSANEIHIPAGRPVEVELKSADVIHSFWVPSLGGKVDLVPGQVNSTTLFAQAPGTYLGQCAEFCGEQHAHMKIVVVAHDPEDWQRWLAHEREPAKPPISAAQVHGKLVFESQPCVLCHQIRGTRAHGLIGPDLTHVGGRAAIAANMLPNNRGFLGAWVTRAHTLKPGVEMPDLTTMQGSELDALTQYLEGLQ